MSKIDKEPRWKKVERERLKEYRTVKGRLRRSHLRVLSLETDMKNLRSQFTNLLLVFRDLLTECHHCERIKPKVLSLMEFIE